MKLFKLPSGTSYYGDQKVLPMEAIGTLVELENLVKDAANELEILKNEFVEKQTVAVEKAKEEAYQEALTIYNQHIFAMDAAIKTLRTQLLQKVLPLALNAAKKIVGEQLKLHPETIVGMVQKQLVQCSSCKRIKILVSKEDKAVLDENKSALKEKLDQLESLSIEESADLTPGSVMIHTDAGTINASLDLQWKALEAAFSRFMQQS